jgi:hypothetical protein
MRAGVWPADILRGRLMKIGARVIEHIARIRIHLPTSCSEGELFRTIALRLAPSSGRRVRAPRVMINRS